MPAEPRCPAHPVRAVNLSASSENKIHDDATAQRFGFKGALVPGVEVFAYMAHVPVRHFGRAWLEQSEAECRFPSNGTILAAITQGKEGGEEYDKAYPERLRQTIY